MSADHGGRDGGGRRPGSKTRWPKGKSGNPRGRPKKKEATDTCSGFESMSEIILSEASRVVTLTEGGKPISMPSGQAVVRATHLNALRGNSNAQRTVMQMTTAAREASEKRRRDEYAEALAIKIQLEHDRKVWVGQGKAEIDMPRHPSDLEIDHSTMIIMNYLLFTEEQLSARKKVIAWRDYLFEKLERIAEVVEEDGDDIILETSRELAKELLRTTNRLLPPRFRRILPGDPVPYSLDGSPEETWRRMLGQLFCVPSKKAPDA